MDVVIPNNNKLQFYLKEIYDSNKFDKQDMLTWEQLPAIIKTNFDQTKAYFEKIVKAADVYKQNTGGNSVQCNTYESTNQMANYGNKLREWIQQIASNSTNNKFAIMNTQATKINTYMEAEITKLMAILAQMANKSNNGNNVNPNTSSGDWESRCPQNKKPCNMGRYCHSHGYHPVGANHTSANCSWKKDGHKDEATWTNTLGGDTFWPSAKCIAINQQNHTTWKGIDRDQGLHYIQRTILIQLHLTK